MTTHKWLFLFTQVYLNLGLFIRMTSLCDIKKSSLGPAQILLLYSRKLDLAAIEYALTFAENQFF